MLAWRRRRSAPARHPAAHRGCPSRSRSRRCSSSRRPRRASCGRSTPRSTTTPSSPRRGWPGGSTSAATHRRTRSSTTSRCTRTGGSSASPPFPALLLVPLVAISGSAERTPDGLFFLLIAAAAPGLLYRALEALREAGASARSWTENAIIAALLPLATVFWFTSVQGTVWFASHVVAVALAAGYVWASAGGPEPGRGRQLAHPGVRDETPARPRSSPLPCSSSGASRRRES
jgi:hypothetical protein